MLYSVAVDSLGRLSDYSETLIVYAKDVFEARDTAERFVGQADYGREILSSEAYSLGPWDAPKVIGRLINTDEE